MKHSFVEGLITFNGKLADLGQMVKTCQHLPIDPKWLVDRKKRLLSFFKGNLGPRLLLNFG